MGKLIYLDNAATTKTSPTVVEAMLPYFTEYYGNASSIYSIGTKSKEAINKSRETIAATLGAKPEEIYFTAGGSESDNWALKATAEAYESKGKHIIKVCDGTACHVRQSTPVLEALWKALGLSRKKHTTDDMMFTVETVSCLGACGLAPTMMVNEQVHPSMTPEKALALLEELRGRG